MSELFDDAKPVDEGLARHLAADFQTIEFSSEAMSIAPADVALDLDSDHEMPILWVLSAKAHRQLVDWALHCLYTEDTDEYYSKAGVARQSGMSRQAVSEYIDDLAIVDIFKTTGDKRKRYAPNEDSDVLRALASANESATRILDSRDES